MAEDIKAMFKAFFQPRKKFEGQGHRLGTAQEAGVQPKKRVPPTNIGTTNSRKSASTHAQGYAPCAEPGAPKQRAESTALEQQTTDANSNRAPPSTSYAADTKHDIHENSHATSLLPSAVPKSTLRHERQESSQQHQPDSDTERLQNEATVSATLDAGDLSDLQHMLVLVATQAQGIEGLKLVHKLLSNIRNFPREAKYRQLRIANAKIMNLMSLHGSLELFQACGFQEVEERNDRFMTLPMDHALTVLTAALEQIDLLLTYENLDSTGAGDHFTTNASAPHRIADVHNSGVEASSSAGHDGCAAVVSAPQEKIKLREGSIAEGGETAIAEKDARAEKSMHGAESSTQALVNGVDVPLRAQERSEVAVPRNTQVILPIPADARVPDWFFERTGGDVKSEVHALIKKREASEMLTTRAWKERQAAKNRPVYVAATLRVRFPDGLCLQGAFGAQEPLSAVHQWVGDSLCVEGSVYELVGPTRRPLPMQGTVRSADLMPAALLNFRALDASTAAAGSTRHWLKDNLLKNATLAAE